MREERRAAEAARFRGRGKRPETRTHLQRVSIKCTMHRNCNARYRAMKTATLPSLRVAPELREAAENVLHEGETLSSFLESALRAQIDQRRMQDEFVARGLASRDRACQTGRYIPAAEVLSRLEAQLEKARKKK